MYWGANHYFRPNPHRTRDATRRAMRCKQMGSIDGVSTLHASNIKGKTFEFTGTSCPASCVDWALATSDNLSFVFGVEMSYSPQGMGCKMKCDTKTKLHKDSETSRKGICFIQEAVRNRFEAASNSISIRKLYEPS